MTSSSDKKIEEPRTPSEWIKHRIHNEALPYYEKRAHEGRAKAPKNLNTFRKLDEELEQAKNQIEKDTRESNLKKYGRESLDGSQKKQIDEEKELKLFKAYVDLIEKRYQAKIEKYVAQQVPAHIKAFSIFKSGADAEHKKITPVKKAGFINQMNDDPYGRHESRLLGAILTEIYGNYKHLLPLHNEKWTEHLDVSSYKGVVFKAIPPEFKPSTPKVDVAAETSPDAGDSKPESPSASSPRASRSGSR